MRSLLVRVKRLEEAVARAKLREAQRAAELSLPLDEVETQLRRQVAISKLFDSLEASYPADPFDAAGLPRLTTWQKVGAAADRLIACRHTDVDRRVLAALPADALRAFGHSAEDFLAAVGLLHAGPALARGVELDEEKRGPLAA
ncbi:hypothetical protein [Piscinibacter defluvii]|uniref:hypothetical protein n=1 Tax=Piscinibacter defluvii TaxID=1796922 RepID=UPI000FDE877C|nr:hypothetical protein [Piscinibacter defluvii]